MSDLCETVWLLWGKTDHTDKRSERYHPLLCHMMDVAAVVEVMWDRVLTKAIRQNIASALQLSSDASRSTLAFWVALHDLGKASPAFQRQQEPLMCRLIEAGLPFPQTYGHEPSYHGRITAKELPFLLEKQTRLPKRVASQVAKAVGGHHGTWPSSYDLRNVPKSHRGDDAWAGLRFCLVRLLAETLDPSPVTSLGMDQRGMNAFLTLLSGLTSVADWIASMQDPFRCAEEHSLGYLSQARSRAKKALCMIRFADWQPPTEQANFSALFPQTPQPNAMQQAVIELAPTLHQPGLVIIEAPTGVGKTEAALYLADHWACTLHQRGLYVAMPTMATSNAMYARVKEMLGQRYPHLVIEPLLVHSQARWQDDFRVHAMQTSADQEGDDVGDRTWFLAPKRSLLAPLGVGTVDQALLAVLQTRHFFVRLFGLAQKTVIFDEVHAYDTYMVTLFRHLLSWLRSMNTSVILLSATLPSQTRIELIRAYTGSLPVNPMTVPYPCIIWTAGEHVEVVPLPANESRTVALEWIAREPEALAIQLRDELVQGGYAAVVCNTVRRAQEVYMALRRVLPADVHLFLFHAQFPFAWREEITTRVLDRFGKEDKTGQRPWAKAIVVATQVIEQSLDLDFDLMLSDVAPVDLLIQRSGRLHRHLRVARPAPLKRPRLLLCQPKQNNMTIDWGNDGWVYEPYILWRTYLTLQKRSKIVLPSETQALIEAVYGPEPDYPQELGQILSKARGKMAQHCSGETWAAQVRLVPECDSDDLLEAANMALEDENPTLHESLQALTRLGPPTVSVVCCHQVAGAMNLEPDGSGLWVDLDREPDQSLARELARHAVSLSHPGARQAILDDPACSAPGWRKHALLRTYRVAIFRDGVCHIGKYELRLSPELGLFIDQA